VKVAFIVSVFPALSETFVLNQITGLLDRGHEVDIYAQRQGNASQVHPDVTRYGLLERTRYSVPMPENLVIRILEGVVLLATHWRSGSSVLSRALNIPRYGWDAASMRLLYASVPFIQRVCHYDIIHCHFGWNGLLVSQLRDMGVLRGKVVVSFHGADMSSYLRRHGDSAYRFLFQNGDLFLPVSERWRRKLIELGCAEDRSVVHRMGVCCSDLPFHPRSLPSDSVVRVLTIARLVEKKGVEYGIRAVARIRSRHAHVQYTVVGDGPLRQRLQHLIHRLSLAGKVHLLGARNHRYVHRLLVDSHILLCPSVVGADGDQEGIPVAVMEAMGCGLPVIATRHSGIPELVEDGISGFLTPERDADAVAERLMYLIEHSETWPTMGRAGRARIEADYDIEKLNDQLVRRYERLLRAPCQWVGQSRQD
jgi:colanic acid/amylovoran biosynthesis glycosyltransferase